jgi:hypothetical protein
MSTAIVPVDWRAAGFVRSTGWPSIPACRSAWQDASKLPKITDALLKKGYAESDVEKILGGNILRVIDLEEYSVARVDAIHTRSETPESSSGRRCVDHPRASLPSTWAATRSAGSGSCCIPTSNACQRKSATGSASRSGGAASRRKRSRRSRGCDRRAPAHTRLRRAVRVEHRVLPRPGEGRLRSRGAPAQQCDQGRPPDR